MLYKTILPSLLLAATLSTVSAVPLHASQLNRKQDDSTQINPFILLESHWHYLRNITGNAADEVIDGILGDIIDGLTGTDSANSTLDGTSAPSSGNDGDDGLDSIIDDIIGAIVEGAIDGSGSDDRT